MNVPLFYFSFVQTLMNAIFRKRRYLIWCGGRVFGFIVMLMIKRLINNCQIILGARKPNGSKHVSFFHKSQ